MDATRRAQLLGRATGQRAVRNDIQGHAGMVPPQQEARARNTRPTCPAHLAGHRGEYGGGGGTGADALAVGRARVGPQG